MIVPLRVSLRGFAGWQTESDPTRKKTKATIVGEHLPDVSTQRAMQGQKAR